jgi:hypothetical protein
VLQSLVDASATLRDTVVDKVRNEGSQSALREVVRIRAGLNRICTGTQIARDARLKAQCTAADHNTTQAEKKIAGVSPNTTVQ